MEKLILINVDKGSAECFALNSTMGKRISFANAIYFDQRICSLALFNLSSGTSTRVQNGASIDTNSYFKTHSSFP